MSDLIRDVTCWTNEETGYDCHCWPNTNTGEWVARCDELSIAVTGDNIERSIWALDSAIGLHQKQLRNRANHSNGKN